LLIALMLLGILAGCAPLGGCARGRRYAGDEAAGDLVPVTYTYASSGIPPTCRWWKTP
jgi:hypothetical protein